MIRLRELRKKKGVTQLQVAEAISTSVSVYCRYEKGEREPSIDTIIRLADYFGVTCDYLLGRKTTFSVSDFSKTVCKKKLIKNKCNDCLLDLEEDLFELAKAYNNADSQARYEALLILNSSKNELLD